jgi:folate-binding protein YgfZ
VTPALGEALRRSGAVIDPASSRPFHFGDAGGELRAAVEACALAERSDLGRVRATGADVLDLLHRLSTKAVRDLVPGTGSSTVLTTSKGRIVERLFVHRLGPEGVLLVTGPGGASGAIAHLDRYTFSEQTGLEDVTGSWCQLALVGPRAAQALRAAGISVPPPAGSASDEAAGIALHVLGEDGDSVAGFSVVTDARHAARLWTLLEDAVARAGGGPAGELALEAWRVLRGLGRRGRELTEEHNPLEAGLWDAVDFDKGCYVGQEVVARLRTYDKVARAVKGFVLPPGAEVPSPGTPIFDGSRRVGEVTSALVPPGRLCPVVLGYVKRDAAEAGTELRLGEAATAPLATVRDLPFGRTA